MLTYTIATAASMMTDPAVGGAGVDALPVVGGGLSITAATLLILWVRSRLEQFAKDHDELKGRVQRAEDRIESMRIDHARLEPKLTRIEQDLDEIKEMMRAALERREGS
jgi:hypothetical protein